MNLAAGQHLGRYEIVALLGAGGMGQVYKARDLQLRRDVAIKVLNSDAATRSLLSDALRREAMAAAAVSHPHICTLYDLGQDGASPFIVMEYLEGETLASRVAKGPMPVADVVTIGIDICEALAAAHRSGLIHRDLKPSNVMLTGTGAKLLDFGLARIRGTALLQRHGEAATASEATVADMLMGTLQYMAPEQIDYAAVDYRADIFALGAVLYEMLTRRRAFEGSSRSSTIAAILQREPPSIKAVRPDVPQMLAALIKTCLAKRPEDRWQSAADIAVTLRAVHAAHGRKREASPADRQAARTVRSLAVLPLENGTGDPTQQYLADGMTDALTTSMATIGRLKVISRSSAMEYRDSSKSLDQIAGELGVQGLIRGSVALSASTVTVAVRLLRANSPDVVWSEVYERPLTSLFRVQGEIAETIAAEIHLKLTASERRRFRAHRPTLPEVSEALLRGRYYWNRETSEALKRSFQHLTVAVQRDPDYAPGHAAMADWYLSAGNYGLLPVPEAIAKARTSALRALELDSDLAQAYACLGRIAMHEWDLQRARAEFETALRLSPNLVEPVVWSARALGYLSLHNEAIARAELAKRLDPVSPRTYLAASAVYYIAGYPDRAVEESRKAHEFEPRLPLAFYYIGVSQLRLGRANDAVASLEDAVLHSERHPAPLAGLAAALAGCGRTAEAWRILDEMKERATRAEVSPYYFAEVYLALGDTPKALEYLQRSYDLRIPDMIGIGVDPLFYPLHGDPQFQELLARLALAPRDTAVKAQQR
jgi:serine/threonine-protein kinase